MQYMQYPFKLVQINFLLFLRVIDSENTLN